MLMLGLVLVGFVMVIASLWMLGKVMASNPTDNSVNGGGNGSRKNR